MRIHRYIAVTAGASAARWLWLAPALGLWYAGAEASPLRASHLEVAPAPFGFETLTVACDLENKGSRLLSEGPANARHFRYWISDNTGGCWESGWHVVPAVDRRQKVRATSTISMVPDPTSARSVTEITITLFLHDGWQARKALSRRYHRWRDGLFRPLPERVWAGPGPGGPTTGPSLSQPQVGPPMVGVQLAPTVARRLKAQEVSWGALKVRYR